MAPSSTTLEEMLLLLRNSTNIFFFSERQILNENCAESHEEKHAERTHCRLGMGIMPGRVICNTKLAYNPPGPIHLIILGTGLNGGLFFLITVRCSKVQTLHYCEHCIMFCCLKNSLF